jgi:hypothetical protein
VGEGKMTKKKINVQGSEIIIIEDKKYDYISLTDIAKFKNKEATGLVISHWLSTRFTVEFMGLWERLYNPEFNVTEFSNIKNEAGANGYVLSAKQWIQKTNAIGIRSKAGRYGGTYAHKDIAFEFASWISAEFKLYLIKEFQRLKEEENERKKLGWDSKRLLTKINYKIHTDAIKDNLVPPKITKFQESLIYAEEADILNIALFGLTAKHWREKNPKEDGNIRDYAQVEQLVCLANLESLNAEFIRQGLSKEQRLLRLNEIAIIQMKSLTENKSVKQLEGN